MEEKADNSLLKKKAEVFLKMKLPVHIILKDTRRFLNGQIVEILKEYMIVSDTKVYSVPVFYDEIFALEKYCFRGYDYVKPSIPAAEQESMPKPAVAHSTAKPEQTRAKVEE